MLSNEYAAGFFDGEGWAGISIKSRGSDGIKYPKSLRTTVGQTNKAVLEPFREKWGGNISEELRRLPAKTYYCWECTGTTAERFLRDIHPYLILKKKEVGLVLLFRKHQLERQKEKGTNIKLDNAEIAWRETLVSNLMEVRAMR